MSAIDDAGRLLDYAKAAPDGFDRDDIRIAYGWNRGRFTKAVRALRILLGDSETVNLIAEPNGWGPWRYSLVGTLEGEAWWRTNRERDMLARLLTVRAMNASIVRGTSGRTLEGRRARKLERNIDRLIEDFEDMEP